MSSLFAGLSRTDYQDILRAIGRLIDSQRWCNIRLVERTDGLLLQVRDSQHLERGFSTYLLRDAQVQAMLRDAYKLRGTGRTTRQPLTTRPGMTGNQLLYQTGYLVALRAIGRLMDEEEYRRFRLIERNDGLLLQVKRYQHPRRNFETFLITDTELQALLLSDVEEAR